MISSATATAKSMNSTIEFRMLVMFFTLRNEWFGEKYQKNAMISISRHSSVNILDLRNFFAPPAISMNLSPCL